MMLRALPVVLAVALSGCTSSDVLNPSGDALGAAVNTKGGTPKIGLLPETAAKQLTPREKAETLADLDNSAQPGRAQAAQDNAAGYTAQVTTLRSEGEAARRARLAQIEGNARGVTGSTAPADSYYDPDADAADTN